MADLLDFAIEAHGGLARFESFSALEADLVQGGVLWALKGKPTVLEHAHVRIDLAIEHASHSPFAPTRNHSNFTPDRVTIETPEGEVVEELLDPRASFAGYEMETPWSDAQVGYFAGYTMWTYLTSPFLLKASQRRRSSRGPKVARPGGGSARRSRPRSRRIAASRPIISTTPACFAVTTMRWTSRAAIRRPAT